MVDTYLSDITVFKFLYFIIYFQVYLFMSLPSSIKYFVIFYKWQWRNKVLIFTVIPLQH